jgi:PAS domain S-box-containing protein
MKAQGEHPDEEIKRLQRCINDLVSVLALPATWSGREPSQIAENLLGVLLDMLGLDLAYMRLEDPTGRSPIEMVRFSQPRSPAISSQEIRVLLNQSLPEDPREWPLSARIRIGSGDISIAPRRLGLQGEIGVIIAGSQRLDFPNQTEALLLHVAANQAVIALQQSRRLGEQTRFANELHQLVSQRTAQLAAATEELKLRAGLLQHIPVAAFTLNPDGTPDFVNENWLNYSGQTLEFVRSKPEAWMSAVHPDDQESNSKNFLEGVRSGLGFAMASRLRRNIDGAYRWHLNRAVPLRDAEGRIVRFVGTSTDIEDLKQSQEALQKTEERTRMIIDTALDAVVSIDTHGIITSWNKEAEVIFGWSKEEAIGRQMPELIIPAQLRAAHKQGLTRFLATGEGPVLRKRIEITAIRRSGVEFPVELEILPIKLGQDWSFSAFLRDITEQKKAEAVQAAQAQQAGIRADVSAAFSETDNLGIILNSCAEAIVHHLGAAFARIWMLDESENALALQASAGLYTRLGGAHARVPVGQLKIGRIAEEGKPHITNDVANDERVSDRAWAAREGMVAFAGYPLFVEGRVTGVLAMFARRPLDQTVLDALESVADIIAQGIYRRDAEDKLRKRERSLRLLTETIPQMIWSATASGETDYCKPSDC